MNATGDPVYYNSLDGHANARHDERRDSHALSSARYDELGIPIGFIQIYDAYKFPRSKPLLNLPRNLGAVDIFIGDEALLGKGIGAMALNLFIEKYSEFEYILVCFF